MATKGGSLLGKADSTLAAMSYKEAMADVTPDYGGVYEAQALNQMAFQKGVEDHFNTLHADYNALGDELKETTATMMADLSAGTVPDEAGMEMFNSELNTLRQRLKAAPKGKKGDLERAKIRAELGRLKNSTEGMDQTLTTLGTMIENDQFDTLTTGQDLPLLLAISKGEATKKIENGNLVYSIKNPAGKDITMTQQDLKEALVLKDPKHAGNFNKIHAGFNDLGKIKGTTWEDKRQGAVNAYEKIFTTKNNFGLTINNKQGGMEESYIDALKNGTAGDVIYKTLMEMSSKDNNFKIGNVEFDADKDGDVDAQDFAHPQNGINLINALTNIKDKENFDFQTAKKVAAEFYADGLAKQEFVDGTKLRKTEPPKEIKNPFGTKNIEFASEEGGQKLYKTSTKALADRDAILSGQPFQGIYGDYSAATNGGYMLNGEPISQYDALIQEKVNLMGDRADQLGGSNIGVGFAGAKDLSPYFGPNANEENAVSKLKEIYPNLKISSPVGMREKIKVNGELFYLRGKGKSTPEMEMKRLQEHIASIDPLNPNN